MRLIDADNATQEIKDEEKYLSNEERYGLNTALCILRQAPTVNAVVLPCKVGDTVWVDVRTFPNGDRAPRRYAEALVTSFVFGNRNFIKFRIFSPYVNANNVYKYPISSVGKTVFLTRESAEAALAERRADG